MHVKTIFDLCEPRKDVVKGDIAKSDFAADLAQVIKGTAPDEYLKPQLFFGTTYPTRGLKNLPANVCVRLRKAGRGRRSFGSSLVLHRLSFPFHSRSAARQIRHVRADTEARLFAGRTDALHQVLDRKQGKYEVLRQV